MLKHAATVNQIVKGLGAVVENQPTILRFLIKNWAITGIVCTAYGLQLLHRYNKKDLQWFGAVSDLGTVLMPMVALFTIQQLAKEDKTEAALIACRAQISPGPDTKGSAPLPIIGVKSSLSGDSDIVGRLA